VDSGGSGGLWHRGLSGPVDLVVSESLEEEDHLSPAALEEEDHLSPAALEEEDHLSPAALEEEEILELDLVSLEEPERPEDPCWVTETQKVWTSAVRLVSAGLWWSSPEVQSAGCSVASSSRTGSRRGEAARGLPVELLPAIALQTQRSRGLGSPSWKPPGPPGPPGPGPATEVLVKLQNRQNVFS